MIRRLALAMLALFVALVVWATAAQACGYWDCTPLEQGDYCLWYPG